MPYDFADPMYWFDRAEEVRARSDMMCEPGNREVLLRIAADYERLGERAVKAKRLREGGQIEQCEPEIPECAERARTDEAAELQIAQSVLVERYPRR